MKLGVAHASSKSVGSPRCWNQNSALCSGIDWPSLRLALCSPPSTTWLQNDPPRANPRGGSNSADHFQNCSALRQQITRLRANGTSRQKTPTGKGGRTITVTHDSTGRSRAVTVSAVYASSRGGMHSSLPVFIGAVLIDTKHSGQCSPPWRPPSSSFVHLARPLRIRPHSSHSPQSCLSKHDSDLLRTAYHQPHSGTELVERSGAHRTQGIAFNIRFTDAGHRLPSCESKFSRACLVLSLSQG